MAYALPALIGDGVEAAAARHRLLQDELSPRHRNLDAIVTTAGHAGHGPAIAPDHVRIADDTGLGEYLADGGADALHEAGPGQEFHVFGDSQALRGQKAFGMALCVVEYGHFTSEIW